jgi:hypothetical protein
LAEILKKSLNMRNIFIIVVCYFLISCNNSSNKVEKTKSKDFTQITDISQVKRIALDIDSVQNKYDCYFYLYKLNEAINLKNSNSRLSSFDIKDLIKIVDTVYDFFNEDKKFERVFLFDSLNNKNDRSLFDALKKQYYYGSGVELEAVNSEGNYFDKNDERNINTNFFVFRNQRPNISSLEFYYFKVDDKLIRLDLSKVETKVGELESKILKILNYKDVGEARIRTNYIASIIKQKDSSYLVSYNVEHESGKETKYVEDGKIQFKVSSKLSLLPNSLQFIDETTKKTHNL